MISRAIRWAAWALPSSGIAGALVAISGALAYSIDLEFNRAVLITLGVVSTVAVVCSWMAIAVWLVLASRFPRIDATWLRVLPGFVSVWLLIAHIPTVWFPPGPPSLAYVVGPSFLALSGLIPRVLDPLLRPGALPHARAAV